MASHYSVLGLFDPKRELPDVLTGEPDDVYVDGTGVEHSRFVDASGATLVAHIAEREIVCVTPFFTAGLEASLWTVRHDGACIDETCVHCSGIDVDIFDPRGERPLDVERFATRATLQLTLGAARHPRAPLDGEVATRPVVAFAHELSVFANADEYLASQGDERQLKFAANTFFPTGMFPGAAKGDVSSRAQAMFTGTVLRSSTRKNAWTGGQFLRFVVDAYFGAIDVVADAHENDQPLPGSVATVSAWLVGE